MFGDFDGNDFLLWQRQLGLSGDIGQFSADANADGIVNSVELAIWRTPFGQTATAASLGAAVAEPSSAVLLVLNLAWLAAARGYRLLTAC